MRNIFFISQKVSSCYAWVLLTAALAVLAGCGGGSPASTTTGTTATPPVPTAASVQLLVSSPQMPSSGATQIDLTAVVLGTNRQALAGKTVDFSSSTDTTAFINGISALGVTDANGIATAKLNLGADKTNRKITVTAAADGIAATNTVDVTGTAITVSGSTSLSFGANTTLTFVVKDSAGTPLSNKTVTLTSQTGNTIVSTPANGATDSSGQITATVTATRTGDDIITASAAGASKAQALTIAGDSFAFTSPAANATISLNATQSVSILWTSAGVPSAGKQVTFSATRGTVAGTPATTDAAGAASISISSTSAGPAIISASGPGGTPAAVLNVVFVATSAANVSAQASPSVVQVTSGAASQTNNTSTISATVRDSVGNLVQNARINFNITSDPSGGRLSAASATTDASGSASVTYTSGTTTSPQNGVVISATAVEISGTAIAPQVSGSATLTVGGTALFVRLGTDNTVGVSAINPVAYSKNYIALVTDAAGNPVAAGTQVRFALRPSRYAKGKFTAGATMWIQDPPNITNCVNEDVNYNGILNPGEDTNGNGKLDPGNVAGVTGSAVTDAGGFATATLTYAKEYAYWAEVVLEARAGVVGNDPPSTATFFLPGQASDYSDLTVAPPGQISPFGLGDPASGDNVCTSPF